MLLGLSLLSNISNTSRGLHNICMSERIFTWHICKVLKTGKRSESEKLFPAYSFCTVTFWLGSLVTNQIGHKEKENKPLYPLIQVVEILHPIGLPPILIGVLFNHAS